MSAVALGVAGLGLFSTLYGVNAQKKAQGAANAANQASIDKADNSAWVAYLLQRGIAAPTGTPSGVIPANAPAANTRLPLWATMTPQQPAFTGPVVRRKTPRAS